MSETHRIGVISDTHIPKHGARLPDAVLRHFEDVELILHTGDLSSLVVLDQLSAYAPVEAVQGNHEQPEVVMKIPIKRTLLVGGCEIGMVHILGDRERYFRNARAEFPTARVVVFGHSHIPWVEDRHGVLLVNPGSAMVRRRQPTCTIARLTIMGGAPYAEIIPV
ncbi:MAG TPA: metallophosphoesterase family protein [Ktedonobacterales bacterium]|nr:metallophosphoesterase family protein [Ktedonobacterales bacterium]